MISVHSWTHESQMATAGVGPQIIVSTSEYGLPQNEHRRLALSIIPAGASSPITRHAYPPRATIHGPMADKIDLAAKLALLDGAYQPGIVGYMNDYKLQASMTRPTTSSSSSAAA